MKSYEQEAEEIFDNLLQIDPKEASYETILSDILKASRKNFGSSDSLAKLLVNAWATGLKPSKCEDSPRVPDLTLYLDDLESEVRVDSPPRLFDLNRQKCGKFQARTKDALEAIRDCMYELYHKNCEPQETRITLAALGNQIRDLLPELLLNKLDDPRVRRIDFQLSPDLDFPIELCSVKHNKLLCEKAEISRWYSDGKALFDKDQLEVENVAFVIGHLNADFEPEKNAVMSAATHGTHHVFDNRSDVLEFVFGTNNHQLLQYKGHIAKYQEKRFEKHDYTERTPPSLSMKKGEDLPMSFIGATECYRTFFENRPIIFLNGCDGNIPGNFIGGRISFPRHLQQLRAAAIISTNWPVSEGPASKFSAAFYSSLARGRRIATATKEARKTLLDIAANYEAGKDSDTFHKYFLTAYAYTYFGPSDMTISFRGKNHDGDCNLLR